MRLLLMKSFIAQKVEFIYFLEHLKLLKYRAKLKTIEAMLNQLATWCHNNLSQSCERLHPKFKAMLLLSIISCAISIRQQSVRKNAFSLVFDHDIA